MTDKQCKAIVKAIYDVGRVHVDVLMKDDDDIFLMNIFDSIAECEKENIEEHLQNDR